MCFIGSCCGEFFLRFRFTSALPSLSCTMWFVMQSHIRCLAGVCVWNTYADRKLTPPEEKISFTLLRKIDRKNFSRCYDNNRPIESIAAAAKAAKYMRIHRFTSFLIWISNIIFSLNFALASNYFAASLSNRLVFRHE